MGIAADWRRVGHWLSAHAPAVLARLPAGASDTDLAAAEASMGVALPAPLRESLAAHNGADLYIDDGKRGTPLGRPMALREIVARHRMLVGLFGDGHNDGAARPRAGVRKCWWHRAWVPALTHANGDATCIDLDPAPGGVPGQVFDWAHDAGRGVRRRLRRGVGGVRRGLGGGSVRGRGVCPGGALPGLARVGEPNQVLQQTGHAMSVCSWPDASPA